MFVILCLSLFFYPPPVFWFPVSALPASVLIFSVPPGFLEKSETDKQAVTRLDTTPDGLWLNLFGLNLQSASNFYDISQHVKAANLMDLRTGARGPIWVTVTDPSIKQVINQH